MLLCRKLSKIPSITSLGAVYIKCCSSHQECRIRPRNPYHDPSYEFLPWGPKPRAMSGGKHLVTMSGGVGTGPELMGIVKRVFLTVNAPISFEDLPMGEGADEDEMENLIYSVERNGVCIKGNIEHSYVADYSTLSRNMQLRRALDLFVQLIEMRSYPELMKTTRLKQDIDVVLVRQNVEGEFAMLEHDNSKGIEHLKLTTAYTSRRLAEFAFKYAEKYKRRRVTVIYNMGIMPHSESMLIDALLEVATEYPHVQFRLQSMRSFAFRVTQLNFNGDVLVSSVLSGGMIMNILFGLMRGTGLFCGQNLGDRYAIFEPAARNRGLKLMGKDIVNPVSSLHCGIKLLRYLDHDAIADRIKRALDLTLNEDLVHTQDLGGTATTTEMVENIERRIREDMPEGYKEKMPQLSPEDYYG